MDNLKSIIEALLFVATETLSARKLAEVTEREEREVRETLKGLKEEYERDGRGFVLREVAGGWRLYSQPAYASYVEKLALFADQRRLTQAALETLAVVAYRQPVTRADVSSIRGVSAEGVINSLVSKGLLREVGRLEQPGQPILYGTSRQFLEAFGLKNLSELPPLENFAPDEKTKKEIEEKLVSEQSVPENKELSEPHENVTDSVESTESDTQEEKLSATSETG